MPTTISIPRLTDSEIAKALLSIADKLNDDLPLELLAAMPHGENRVIPKDLEEIPLGSDIRVLLSENSCISKELYLRDANHNIVLQVQRHFTEPFDTLTLETDWIRHIGSPLGEPAPVLAIRLLSLGRKYLKAHEIEAALSSDPSNAWSKYRNAQTGVLNSLQKTAEQIIVDVASKNAEIDRLRAERFEKLEVHLREELATEREKLQEQHELLTKELVEKENQHAEKEAQFQTKEARYVSRQKQQEQVEQIQEWLENWGLTAGTTKKRWPITAAYLAAIVLTGFLTYYATSHNYDLIKDAEDLASLQWWHWFALASKSFFPLAAFTTFVIYFIRWAGAWARQHSEEEFRNRSRLIDIGRSGWLLEAVRDAHENKAEIPADLLKELSRNLFSNSLSGDDDIHPSAFSDVMLQGLSSLRLKSPDGSEIEASRNKSGK